MAVDKTVARSTGKVTLVANTAYTALITEDADYVEIVNDIAAMVYVTISAAEDEIIVTDAGVRAVPRLGVGRFRFAAGQHVNVECASPGDICIQLAWAL